SFRVSPNGIFFSNEKSMLKKGSPRKISRPALPNANDGGANAAGLKKHASVPVGAETPLITHGEFGLPTTFGLAYPLSVPPLPEMFATSPFTTRLYGFPDRARNT